MHSAESSRVHNLLLDMPTPQKQVVFYVTKNKVQLNVMLAEVFLDSSFQEQATSQNLLLRVLQLFLSKLLRLYKE